MDRPYRDDEEKHAKIAAKSLNGGIMELASGYPEEALALARRAAQEILVLQDLIEENDNE